MTRIIGLTGKARSGKDTVADYIENRFTSVRRYALADPLKEAASVMFGIPLDDFYNPEKKESENEFWKVSPREIAQKLGTECAREVFREDFWLKRCEKFLLNNEDPKIFVITDVRFENEAEWVREQGGEVWHIERPELGNGVVREHKSEAGVKFLEGDQVIENNSTLEHLYGQVDSLLR